MEREFTKEENEFLRRYGMLFSFALWVADEVLSIEDGKENEFDFILFAELACRRLEKLGIVKETESGCWEVRDADSD